MIVRLLLVAVVSLQQSSAVTKVAPQDSLRIAAQAAARAADSMHHRAVARADSLHIALLERVNQQINLAADPWSLVVGALSLLFTVGAIAAAYLLYRQSVDFRQQRAKAIEEGRHEMKGVTAALEFAADDLLKNLKAQADLLRADYEKRIEDATKELEKAKGDSKATIESELQSLKTLAAQVETQRKAIIETEQRPRPGLPRGVIRGSVPAPSILRSGLATIGRFLMCNNCEQEFFVRTDKLIPAQEMDSMCPRCGAVQAFRRKGLEKS